MPGRRTTVHDNLAIATGFPELLRVADDETVRRGIDGEGALF